MILKINKDKFSEGVNLDRFKAELVSANITGVIESIDDKITHLFINGDEDLNNVNDINTINEVVSNHDGTDLIITVKTDSEVFYQGIINPNGRIDQRNSFPLTSNTIPDGVYGPDRWFFVASEPSVAGKFEHNSTNNSLEVSATDTVDPPPGTPFQLGLLQFLTKDNIRFFEGKKVSVSFEALAVGISPPTQIRAGIISWDGVADQITRDVVSTWTATPTLITSPNNWTFQNTPSNIAISTSDFTLHKIEDISIPIGVRNLAFFVWLPDLGSDHGFQIRNVQMNEGSVAFPFSPRLFEKELAMARHYFTTFEQAVEFGGIMTGNRFLNTSSRLFRPLDFPMRVIPTLSDNGPANFSVKTGISGDGGVTVTSLTLNSGTTKDFVVIDAAHTSVTSTRATACFLRRSADPVALAKISLDAEL